MKKANTLNLENEKGSAGSGMKSLHTLDFSYWKTWLALLLISIATFTGFYVVWSILFLFWIFVSIKNKELFFVEKVNLLEAPITFWTCIACWLFVSLYVIWEFFVALGLETF